VFGARKDQNRLCSGLTQQFEKERRFEVLLDRIEHMRDATCRSGGINLHLNRCLQYFVGQPKNIIRHGGREQKRLAFCRYVPDDLSDIGQKPHVEHPV